MGEEYDSNLVWADGSSLQTGFHHTPTQELAFALQAGRFSPSCDTNISAIAPGKQWWLDCAGELIDKFPIMVVSRAMSRILRHSNTLVVNQSGFAWMEDLISIMYLEDPILRYARPDPLR